MKKIITNPTVLAKVNKACFLDGNIVVFPNAEYKNYEMSIHTLQALFGECVIIKYESYMNRPCIVISNANFFITNSESMGADIELELKVNDPL